MAEKTKTDTDKLLDDIIDTAKKAGEAILKFYALDGEIQMRQKDDDSPLTKADLASNRVIMNALVKIDPDTPVISEESGIAGYEDRKGWSRFWLVDPLDGTKEFIKKNGEFTVNIALIDEGVPVLGVVYVPDKKITYFATRENGAFKQEGNDDPQRIHSELKGTDKPLSAVQSRSHGSDTMAKELAEKGIKVGETVPAGSSIKFCLVADGTADIYPRMGPTMEWDVAAGDCVYRYSAKGEAHPSPLTYNKPDLKNSSFIIGLKDNVEL